MPETKRVQTTKCKHFNATHKLMRFQRDASKLLLEAKFITDFPHTSCTDFHYKPFAAKTKMQFL